jgi:hypothetical protein
MKRIDRGHVQLGPEDASFPGRGHGARTRTFRDVARVVASTPGQMEGQTALFCVHTCFGRSSVLGIIGALILQLPHARDVPEGGELEGGRCGMRAVLVPRLCGDPRRAVDDIDRVDGP